MPVVNLNVKNIYDSALDFFSQYSPTFTVSTPSPYSPYSSGSDSPSTRFLVTPDTPRDYSAPLRERLDAACLSPTSSIAGLAPSSMRRELDATKHELVKSQSDVVRLQERCKMLEKTLKETREMLRARDAEVEKMKREKEKERLMAERRRSDVGPPQLAYSPPKNLQSRHSSLDMRRKNAYGYPNGRSTPSEISLTESEEERARTRSSEIYMTRTDSWSGAQVLQAVHDINSEILQFAASATELCSFDKDSRPSSSRSIQAMHETSSRLGPNLARILSNRDHSQDPILVQLALQGCVSMAIARALSSFCIGFPAKSDTVLSQVYSRMALAGMLSCMILFIPSEILPTEQQPTFSKWRSLTHRHIHALYPTLADHAVNDLCETILRWSSDVFIIAGCQSYETASTSSRDGLRARFGDQVLRIAKSVTRLARVTREDIMSTSFDVIAVNQSDPYNPNGMSDAFGDYGASRGAILATMELGLRCTTRLRQSESSEADVRLEQRMLLLPKVVLESVLDVLDPR